MFSFLRGRIAEKSPTQVVVEVGGVGYQVRTPVTVSAHLPESGEILIHTVLAVREDAHTLYGFHSKEARGLFTRLLKVTGVGPQMALSIMSGGEVAEIESALSRRDVAWLRSVRGVGEKTAQRLVVELSADYPEGGRADLPGAARDAVEALLTLGFDRKEAERRVAAARKSAGEGAPAARLIQDAVRARIGL